jgi:hypothetical protein
MVLGRSGDEDIPTLIAKKNYSKAIELIRKQLSTRRNDPRLRLQLGDVLVSSGKEAEAVAILLPLADEFAKEGFAAKAISVLKKIQKLEPGRRDIDQRLASLIQEKQRHATVTLSSSAPSAGLEIGMEEIGMEAPAPRAAAAPSPVPARQPEPEPEPEPELEISLGGPASSAPAPTPSPVPAPAPAPPPAPAPRAAPPSGDLELNLEEVAPEAPLSLEADPLPLELDSAPAPKAASPPAAPAPPPAPPAAEPELITLEPVAEAEPEPELTLEPSAALPAEPAPVEDQDLFTGEFEEIEPLTDADAAPEGEPLDPARFAEELMSAIDGAFDALPDTSAATADEEPEVGAQIVVSPLFKDFSVEELVAVIQGLNLLTFDRGQVIIREGEPGNSLYMLTSGTVKAFMKRDGKQIPISELEEGAFFGEVSILTGKPRTATVVAKTRCELLELDRATLDSITQSHPHVLQVLQEFAEQRMAHKA